MNELPTRSQRWRIWSTAESIEQGEPSVTAIIETFVATIFYLWLAASWGFLLPLAFGVIGAPFVLLRTTYSIQAGLILVHSSVHWMDELDRGYFFPAIFVLAAPTILTLALWLFLFRDLPASDLGYALAFSFVGMEAFQIFFISLAIRTVATLKFLRPGIRAFPDNFRRLWMCTSVSQLPEFVPGADKANSAVSLHRLFKSLSANSRGLDRISALVGLLIYAIAILPSWLFRFSIKSAFWFWWPISYLGSDLELREKPALLKWNSVGSLKSKATIVSSAAVLVSFFFANFLLSGSWLKENPLITPIGYLFLLEAPYPWQIPALFAASLSIVIVFLLNDADGKQEIAEKTNDQQLRLKASTLFGWCERLSRLRTVASVAFWLLVAMQAVDYANSKRCLVRSFEWTNVLLEKVYGQRFHQLSCRDYSLWHLFTNKDLERN